jgi:hypothetical protein
MEIDENIDSIETLIDNASGSNVEDVEDNDPSAEDVQNEMVSDVESDDVPAESTLVTGEAMIDDSEE